MRRSFILLVGVFLALLGTLGCVEGPPGHGTRLYVYDNATGEVLAWDNVEVLREHAAHPPAPDRTLRSGTLQGCGPQWGGLAVDASLDCLYLVPATGGTVTRLDQASTRNGSGVPEEAFATFHLGEDGDRYSGGSWFGPASLNPRTGVLYVAETSHDRRHGRIWAISGAAGLRDDATVPRDKAIRWAGSDRGFPGVAGGEGSSFFSFFPHGNTIHHGGHPHDGPRLRMGSLEGGFGKASGAVIAGSATRLADPALAPVFGSLAFDGTRNELYVGRHAAAAELPAVVVFRAGPWLGGPDQAPVRTLPDTAASLPNLRFLTHAVREDWLAGADWVPPAQPPSAGGKGGAGTPKVHLWAKPSEGGPSVPIDLKPHLQIGGLALSGA